jgi:tetratricopeptide (TPR) repeat protein
VADQLFRHEARAFVWNQPRAALGLLLRKLVWTWSDRELPNTVDLEWQKGQSPLFRLPVLPLRLGLVLPLALVGLVMLARRRDTSLLPLLAPIAIAVIAEAIFFTNARFRLVMVPALIILAALAASELPALVKTATRKDRAVTAGAFCAGVLLAWPSWGGVRSYTIPEIAVDTAILEREAGNLASAERELRKAIALRPDDAVAWVQLGLTLEGAGRADDARSAWMAALRAAPNNPLVRRMAHRRFRQLVSPNAQGAP